MACKGMKRCATSLLLWHIQVNIVIRYDDKPTQMAKTKRKQKQNLKSRVIQSFGEDVEVSYILVRMKNDSHLN